MQLPRHCIIKMYSEHLVKAPE